VISDPIRAYNYQTLASDSEIIAPAESAKIYKIIEKMMGKTHAGYKSEKLYESEDFSNPDKLHRAWTYNGDVLMLIKGTSNNTLGVFRHPKMPKTRTFNYIPNGS